jgi:hypothetical protein
MSTSPRAITGSERWNGTSRVTVGAAGVAVGAVVGADVGGRAEGIALGGGFVAAVVPSAPDGPPPPEQAARTAVSATANAVDRWDVSGIERAPEEPAAFCGDMSVPPPDLQAPARSAPDTMGRLRRERRCAAQTGRALRDAVEANGSL